MIEVIAQTQVYPGPHYPENSDGPISNKVQRHEDE